MGEAPLTVGAVRRLGAKRLIVTCRPPCRQRAWVEIDKLALPDDMPLAEVAEKRRLICSACDRRAGQDSISVDWGVTASKPLDRR